MTLDLALRILSLCVALAGVETLHGIARTVLVAPRIGKAPATKLTPKTTTTPVRTRFPIVIAYPSSTP